MKYRRTDTKRRERTGFQRLRGDARAGNAEAVARLRQHVQRRIRAGWNVATVARRLSLTSDEVLMLAGDALVAISDLRPRLRKVGRNLDPMEDR
jgi:hypothetical protein